jgi:hypothetical protein
MAAKNPARLAEILGLAVMPKGGPLGSDCVTGAIEGHPVAVGWTKRGNQATVAFLIRFKTGSLAMPADAFQERLATAPEVLAAMQKKKLSAAERKKLLVGKDGLLLHWDYSLRAPAPEVVAATLRALLGVLRGQAAPVGDDCEICGGTRSGGLHSVKAELVSICPGCRERLGEEDRRALEAYAGRSANPVLGLLFGAVTAAGAAVLWGAIAYSAHRIFLWGGILIGLAIAWAVTKGMGKVTPLGKAITMALTVASVLLGDFIFLWLSLADQLQVPASADLALRLAPHFFELELAESSGYLSILFGLIGAVYVLFAMKPPVAPRVFVPVGPA